MDKIQNTELEWRSSPESLKPDERRRNSGDGFPWGGGQGRGIQRPKAGVGKCLLKMARKKIFLAFPDKRQNWGYLWVTYITKNKFSYIFDKIQNNHWVYFLWYISINEKNSILFERITFHLTGIQTEGALSSNYGCSPIKAGHAKLVVSGIWPRGDILSNTARR